MKDFEEQLPEISADWVRDGLISGPQRAALLERHPVVPRSGNRFVAILSTIGGALLVIGVSLVIASHWRHVGDWTKIAGLLSLLGGAHWAGWRLKISPGRYPRTGEACFMAGGVIFLLGIALVSQIYHLNSRPPNGVLLWWVGIAALPWLVPAKGLQWVSVAALLTWLGLEMGAADSWLRLGSGDMRWENWPLFDVAFFLLGLALLLSGLALRGASRAEYAGLHETWGLVILCFALYSLGFAWSHYMEWRQLPAGMRAMPFLVFGALAVAAFAWAWRNNRADALRLILWVVPALVAVGGFLFGTHDFGERWLWGAAACVALFVLNIGMIHAGLAAGRESWINLGVAMIALNILTRYLDLFGTMLEGGVFFLVTGIIVLGLGLYLERKRRGFMAVLRKDRA